jgi:hypothetical protein
MSKKEINSGKYEKYKKYRYTKYTMQNHKKEIMNKNTTNRGLTNK